MTLKDLRSLKPGDLVKFKGSSNHRANYMVVMCVRPAGETNNKYNVTSVELSNGQYPYYHLTKVKSRQPT